MFANKGFSGEVPDMSSPGAIGGTTPAAGTFTTIKTMDNIADTTLSGTPKVFVIYDSTGTPYYFKAYPVKP